MVFKNVKKEQWQEIKDIYMEAFPKAERKPFCSIKRSVKKGKAQIITAIEDGILQGYIMVIPYKDMVMVDYLAVSGKIRSKGTGSRIMQEVCDRFGGKRIVLLIERLDENASNSEQREARRRFYLKNGFKSSDNFINGASGEMEVMIYGGNITGDEFMELMKYALGKLFFKFSGISILRG